MFKKRFLALLIVSILIASIPFSAGIASSANPSFSQDEVFLWQGTPPNSEELQLTETVIERSKDPNILDRAITKITAPSIIPVLPPEGKANGVAVLICPGGAYERVVVDKEGYDIAKWLNSQGITAFILKYRLPAEGHQFGYNVPLQDAQKAMRVIRQNAAKWNLDTNKIGVMGFSAGGHLASTLGTKYNVPSYEPKEALDSLSCKPDFMVLMYPVISMKPELMHEGSRNNLIGKEPAQALVDEFSSDLHVDANTPPTFIAQAHDDSVSTLNSIAFYSALKAAKVNAEIHIFREGGHGYGIRGAKGPVSQWTKLCGEWLTTYVVNTKK